MVLRPHSPSPECPIPDLSQLEQRWPELRRLLLTQLAALLSDADAVQRQALETILAENAQHKMDAWGSLLHFLSAPSGAAGVTTHVQRRRAVWQAFGRWCERSLAVARDVPPFLEAWIWFSTAVHLRRVYRHWLHRFGRPGSMADPGAVLYAHQAYALGNGLFLAGLAGAWQAQTHHRDPIVGALRAMWHVFQRESVLLAGFGLNMPPASPWQETATWTVAGWARQQVRLYPSLRAALAKDGDPRTVLLTQLPAAVVQAWHTEARQDPRHLLRAVQRIIGQARRRPPRSRRARPPVLDPVAAASAQWAAHQQLTDLAERAPLSRAERTMLMLRLQGMKYRDIATTLGCSMNTVRKTLSRCKAKLRRETHP
jgi:DNA-binding CsgD family transcriptional regulator